MDDDQAFDIIRGKDPQVSQDKDQTDDTVRRFEVQTLPGEHGDKEADEEDFNEKPSSLKGRLTVCLRDWFPNINPRKGYTAADSGEFRRQQPRSGCPTKLPLGLKKINNWSDLQNPGLASPTNRSRSPRATATTKLRRRDHQ